MKLVAVSCNTIPRMPGMRPGDLITIECETTTGPMKGWRISIRGQQVFFISPRGWVRNADARRDPDGPLTVFEVPRSDVTLQWGGNPDELEAILKSGKYDSEPFGPPPPPPAPPAVATELGDA